MLPACSTTTEEGPGCANGVRDEGEEGTDCGGICPSKCAGSGCTTGEECASGKCESGVCGAPAGKPCGVGVATQCHDGDPCELDKDCASGFCDVGKCAVPSSESHSDGKKNGGETGIDCGGTVKADKPCPDGQGCTDSTDCVGTCTNLICGPIGPADGKKNLDETDIDCGGATAPKCANGKACLAKTDCVDDYCADATKKCTAPTYEDGVQNGTETDLDCGGTGPGMKKCAETKSCLVDGDCNGACKYDKTCIDTPSCKPRFGGDTCGSGGPGSIPLTAAAYESCCRSLPTGYADANQPGKAVYLDKYEITAGRMRAFLDAVAAQNGGVPDVKGYMATHRPASRWNPGWENALPAAMIGGSATFTTSNPTVDLLYPGQDRYMANAPTQNTWSVASGTWTIYPDVARSLGGQPFFPEYVTGPSWPTTDYAVTHGFNCSNSPGSYGFSTYWFDQATMAAVGSGTQGKYYSKDEMDQKALNCTPAGLFAAFCAWDGGQLATAEVIDYVTSNGAALSAGTTNCGNNTLVTQSDAGTGGCYNVYFYPNDMGNTFDGSARIAPPGRVPADVVAFGGQEWNDLKGNLVETVLLSNGLFGNRGYGMGWGTAAHHRNQQTTPRHKTGTFGARCMRFK
ncbi:MAG TPA: hypothetical protein VLT33_14510 [Labilithrix sp.]|nr:hypothetical protein [Labilithrix sp.]